MKQPCLNKMTTDFNRPTHIPTQNGATLNIPTTSTISDFWLSIPLKPCTLSLGSSFKYGHELILLFFSSLQILSVGGNQISEVPDSVGRLTSLQALVLSDNYIEQLPASIACLDQLRSLLIHKNRLKTLPTQIIKLRCLTEVRLSDIVISMSASDSNNLSVLLLIVDK